MGGFVPISPEAERAATSIVDAAPKVHRVLGPGLLESVYEACLCHELRQRGVSVASQVAVPVTYDGVRLETGLRLDMLVSGTVIVEVKATEQIVPLFEAQLLTYLKLSGLRLGLLINFNVPRIKDGIRRMVL